jgi:hypothetical protein
LTIMVATGMARQTDAWHPEALAVWPDGFWVTLLELRSGEYNHRSDDFEVVPHDDRARMQELGIAEEVAPENLG